MGGLSFLRASTLCVDSCCPITNFNSMTCLRNSEEISSRKKTHGWATFCVWSFRRQNLCVHRGFVPCLGCCDVQMIYLCVSGGTASVYVGQPLDTVKVKMQTFPTMYRNAYHCFKTTLVQEGVRRGLYAGTVPSLAAQVCTNTREHVQIQDFIQSEWGTDRRFEFGWGPGIDPNFQM